MNGWIKLHRRLMGWEWYKDSQTVHLFIHLTLRANHEEGRWQGRKVQRGQLITGRKQLSIETGISEKGVRTRLQRLKNSGEILIKSASKFSVITICNYDEYQSCENENGQHSGQQRANKGPTKGQQRATNKKNKELKKEKNNISLGENHDGAATDNHAGSAWGNGAASRQKNKNGKSIMQQIHDIRPDWWSEKEWAELISIRRAVKATITPRAFRLLIGQFDIALKQGETPESILNDLSQYGWKGYKWEWGQNRRGPGRVNGNKGGNTQQQPRNITEAKIMQNNAVAKMLLKKRRARNGEENKREAHNGDDRGAGLLMEPEVQGNILDPRGN